MHDHNPGTSQGQQPSSASRFMEPAASIPVDVPGPFPPQPLFLIIVELPKDWKPQTLRSFPPCASTRMPLLAAAQAAIVMNRQRMTNAALRGRPIYSWSVVTAAGGKTAIISIHLPEGFHPAAPTDLPPVATFFEGSGDEAWQTARRMNKSLYWDRRWCVVIHDTAEAIKTGQNSIEPSLREERSRRVNPWERPSTDAVADPETRESCDCNDRKAATSSTFSTSRVALVHPSYGTIAISPHALPEADVAVILAEARPAILRASEGGAV